LDLSRRACAKAAKTWRGWVDELKLERQVVVIAFERIRASAGPTGSLAERCRRVTRPANMRFMTSCRPRRSSSAKVA
jgi:hypothetical protein